MDDGPQARNPSETHGWLRPLVVAGAMGVAALALGVLAFEVWADAAQPHPNDPASYDAFFAKARLVFAGLYGAALLVSFGAGATVACPEGRRPWLVASVVALTAILEFFLLQFLDFFHSCYLGRALFLGNEC